MPSAPANSINTHEPKEVDKAALPRAFRHQTSELLRDPQITQLTMENSAC
jgi:hypothetical protein